MCGILYYDIVWTLLTSCFVFSAINRANWVKLNGKKYEKDAVLIIGQMNDHPVFGQIVDVLVDGPTVLFDISVLNTVQFVEKLHAFAVQMQTGHRHLFLSSDILDVHPYCLYRPPSHTHDHMYYVVIKGAVF